MPLLLPGLGIVQRQSIQTDGARGRVWGLVFTSYDLQRTQGFRRTLSRHFAVVEICFLLEH